MIKTECGKTKIEGSLIDLLTDISLIASTLKKCGIKKADVIHAIEVGYMTEEERKEKVNDELKDFLNEFKGFIKGILGSMEEEDGE